MKAAWYLDIGPAEVLQVGEMPKPDPKAGQVQVRIHAHGVNPTDWKRRAGQRGGAPTERMIPGYDGAGVIAALGDGVSTARLGERVWVWEGFHQQPHGTAAEFVCVDQSRAIALPTSLSFEEGACLGVPALTACHSLMLAGPLDGEAVIVTGAAGVVCNYAVQLAKVMGARVLALVRGDADKEEDAYRAGADQVINADRDDFLKAALSFTDGQGARCLVDVDLGAHLHIASRITAINGTIASFGSASNPKPEIDWAPFMHRNIHLCGVGIFSVPESRKLEAAAFVQRCLQAGQLWHRIDSRWPLEGIADAHRRQESGRPRGKVIVQIDS
ncbi:MAG: NADPH:quinone reductase [Betaproteobacteria bacterium]|jgi:NADPH:quinone reductase|nr:NADPH:quinone reductase [Betaproteobacteria bacterium]NDG81834.1 NADPH:quinone reductase [Betaproteobacteria bacterium]